ncbi:hypothetical protein BD560DRAFT_417242, partial [Blakeslea trispora]
ENDVFSIKAAGFLLYSLSYIMADQFIGLKVSVLLNTTIRLEGVVNQIEPKDHQMILKDVTLLLPGQPPYQAPLYGVYGKDIKDLQVIESVENLEKHHVLDQPSSFQPDKMPTPMKSMSKSKPF